MTPESVVTLGEHALVVTSLVAAPLLLVALVAGVVIGMLQAATQINEATLSFIPKLLALVATIFVAGHWMLATMIDYTRTLFESIPSAIN
jgi:flagellar biosynthetic protein FliQ